ncbi:hypothetical protein K491DRAFT_719106 [Lophiostoma macrostomum CBS 122681]|uniref:Xylanolytic transcriptional activator regulatory domain-containing protein n=1 Tax=Lophiostoma macrostomum CBS 122681 TaxID=1314788 RepID=A0A6A6SWY4_9PLEO|nr:hypothetical protein K491DRAFT_719106 [Lophiostoma macrostomum CBS 122681]
MTKPAGTPRKQPEPRKRVVKPRSETRESRGHGRLPSLQLSPRQEASLVSAHTTLGHEAGSVGSCVNVWPTPPESATRTTQSSEWTRSSFLGSTSYASVFSEDGPLPDCLHSDTRQTDHSTIAIVNDTSVPSAPITTDVGSRFCQVGVGPQIVAKFSPFRLFEQSIVNYFETNKASALEGALVISALPQLRLDIEHLLSAKDDSFPVYAEVTRNSMQPLKVPSTMPASEFHTLFTGPNLRWEMMGLVLIVAGSNAQFTSPDDPIFTLEDGSKIDKDRFIEDMIHTSNDCIDLCQVHGAVSDIMVWLIYLNMLVTSNFYGDNYHGVWRRLGDCISTLYSAGIHCEDDFDEPFFLREARRRLYAAVYRSDKTLATFFGRPPMMAERYSDRKVPLDLDDNTISTSDPDALNRALAKLDENGWDTDGRIWSTSWVRLRYNMAVVKEQILEQSLAGKANDDDAAKIEAISSRCRHVWESVPSHLRYDLYDEDVAWTELDPAITIRMISSYLEYLHMEFSMQRLLRRQTEAAIPAMLEFSMKLLSTVLVFNKQRQQAYAIQRHYPTIMLYFCLPSAGVLALELRRCTLENRPLPGTVSRADVIRNLSVLISCLEWVVLPGDGNHRLCKELNQMMALVLDEVLNYQPPQHDESQDNAAQSGMVTGGGGFFDMPMVEGMEPIPTEPQDFLNWLDNANWNNTYLF